MTTPTYDILARLHTRMGGSEATFGALVVDYMRTGYVFASADYFVMGKRIGDGWYIHAAAGIGAIETFCRFMPFHLPWIGWERRGGKTRWYRTEKLLRKLHYEESKSTGTYAATSSKQE